MKIILELTEAQVKTLRSQLTIPPFQELASLTSKSNEPTIDDVRKAVIERAKRVNSVPATVAYLQTIVGTSKVSEITPSDYARVISELAAG